MAGSDVVAELARVVRRGACGYAVESSDLRVAVAVESRIL
jgi:hypothetical protein